MLPTENELRDRYAAYSNSRLLQIIHNKNEYTAQALEVAKAELAARDLSAADVDIFLEEQEEQQLAARILALVPLKFWEKAMFFFFWFAPWFLSGALRMNFREDGYALKLRQSHTFSIGGFVSTLFATFVSVYFESGTVTGIAILIVSFFVFLWIERKITYELTLPRSKSSSDL